jgi:GntR family transcriptional repressor for pyruvate dehydrogenase complex
MGTASASEAARRIRQYIVRHRLRPGDQLPRHEELVERLKLGPRRLREGLSILMHHGIVETRSKGGTIVCRPNVETLSEPLGWHLDATGYRVEDLVSARAWLESGMAAEAAVHRTARDLLVILDALEQLEVDARDGHDDLAEEEAFHLAIMQATHNPVMLTFGQLVTCQLRQSGATPDSESLPRRRRTLQEHRAIYEAIERRDRQSARDLMYAHVANQLTEP